MSKSDGGYYAIKGFLYQFDKTIIELLRNPEVKIQFESTQDIIYQDYVIQVKNKETQTYSLSKIKEPVLKLFDLFHTDKSKKYRLYCHFNDKRTQESKLSKDDLNTLLSDNKDNYTDELKDKFIDNFIIQFSDNYEEQFIDLITLIKDRYSISENRAYIYHSIIRERLLSLSIKEKKDRSLTKQDLDLFIDDKEKCIFFESYSKYLQEKEYEKIIKSDYFTFKTANIDNFERLFIVPCNLATETHCLLRLANQLSKRYFIHKKSPQPYLCFHNLKMSDLNSLKIELIDQELLFNDGTCFDGDRFRVDKLIQKQIEHQETKLKIINFEKLQDVLSNHRFHEIYQFYFKTPIDIYQNIKNIKIQVNTTEQILNMI